MLEIDPNLVVFADLVVKADMWHVIEISMHLNYQFCFLWVSDLWLNLLQSFTNIYV